MTGGDMTRITQRAMLLRLAEKRRDEYSMHLAKLKYLGSDGGDAVTDAELDEALANVRSAGAAVGGIRRGMRRMVDRVLASGVDRPALKALPHEQDER